MIFTHWRSLEDHFWISYIGARSYNGEVALEMTKIFIMPEAWDIYRGKLVIGSGTSPDKEVCCSHNDEKKLEL